MKFDCKRCGHEWIGRIETGPKQCPGCKNPNWNRSRVELLDLAGVLAIGVDEVGTCGVYFLIKRDSTDREAVVYVGSSTNVARRTGSHEVPFDRYTFIPTPDKDLRHIEKDYIRHLAPPLNQSHNPRATKRAGGKRSGAGRPVEPGKTVIVIRTHDKTKAAIAAKAAARGMSLSEYMIRAAIERGFDNQA